MDPLRVLLIEDDEDDYILARYMLSQIEDGTYDLEWVQTYEGGLEAVGQSRHDLYLVDYRLGERNGLDLLQKAISEGCKKPFILLTG